MNELKESVCNTIDDNAEHIINFAKSIQSTPELGFKEKITTKKVSDFLKDAGFKTKENIALTGVKTKLKEDSDGPNIAVLGELDAVICNDSPLANKETGAAHTCGHHLQLAAMAGCALGLKLSNVANYLDGNATFMAVPAEEYIEISYREKLRKEGKIHFLAGKQELIYRGEFDDVNIAMMIHSLKNSPYPTAAIGQTSNGFLGKTVHYIGKAAHAAEAPHEGINALNAALLGLSGINALRETFRDEDSIRVHPIITKGGDSVNNVPADVQIETYVRSKNITALRETNEKIDRALLAGGYAIGAKTIINTIPGHLPLNCCIPLNSLFIDNCRKFLPDNRIIDAGHFAASTDMGDVSNLIPAIHPFIGGVNGALHTKDFKVCDFNAACILPAKVMAMTIIDLLYSSAKNAKNILQNFKPSLSKDEYINLLEECFQEKVI